MPELKVSVLHLVMESSPFASPELPLQPPAGRKPEKWRTNPTVETPLFPNLLPMLYSQYHFMQVWSIEISFSPVVQTKSALLHKKRQAKCRITGKMTYGGSLALRRRTGLLRTPFRPL
jgi:hypothetical protein